MIKAVLFDFNGVIVDDEPVQEQAFRMTLVPFGIDLTHEQYQQFCAGKTDKLGYEQISSNLEIDLPIQQLLKEKDSAYQSIFETQVQPVKGVENIIKKLSEQYTLAVVSSSSRAVIEMLLQAFHLDTYFQTIVSAEDVSIGKPDPEPYQKGAAKLGFQTNECVVIEDSQSGVRSAKAAGCRCIGILTTHTREQLAEADEIVESYEKMRTAF